MNIFQPKLKLILLPGLDGTGQLFSALISQLPSHIEPLVMRYPTHQKLGYHALVNIIKSQIPPNQPYLLLGESFSGPIAIALAASADKQLKGVILSCTFAKNPRPILSKIGFLVPTLTVKKWMLPLIHLLLGTSQNIRLQQQLFEVLQLVSPEVMRFRLDEVMHVDEVQALKNMHQPILYLQAKRDYLVPQSATDALLKVASHAQLIQLDACHLLLQAMPKEAASYISKFASQLDF